MIIDHPEPAVTEADVKAAIAVMNGTADAAMQKHFIAWLLTEPCHLNGLVPAGGDHQHHEGRRFVGVHVLKMREPGALEAAIKRADEREQAASIDALGAQVRRPRVNRRKPT